MTGPTNPTPNPFQSANQDRHSNEIHELRNEIMRLENIIAKSSNGGIFGQKEFVSKLIVIVGATLLTGFLAAGWLETRLTDLMVTNSPYSRDKQGIQQKQELQDSEIKELEVEYKEVYINYLEILQNQKDMME